mmetsp:Transcript_110752/g.202898  ORF Transcript_110752/g.202898 Transcript_110752/m.202898 type:complete len:165 (-) Transcript_110752:280-774(-)
MAFLSNVDMDAQRPFVVSFLSYLFQSFLFFPTLVAIVYVTAANCTLQFFRPEMFEQAHKKYEINYQESNSMENELQEKDTSIERDMHKAEMLKGAAEFGDDITQKKVEPQNKVHSLDEIDLLVEEARQRRSMMQAEWNKIFVHVDGLEKTLHSHCNTPRKEMTV